MSIDSFMEEALRSKWTTSLYCLFFIKRGDSYTYCKSTAEMENSIAELLFQDGVSTIKEIGDAVGFSWLIFKPCEPLEETVNYLD